MNKYNAKSCSVAIGSAVMLAFSSGVLFADELDSRYTDRTGNLVADPPEDESQWLDPDVLVFAYSPVEDPAVYEEVFAEFTEHLQSELDRTVQWFGVQSTSAQIEAMRAGRLHVSGFASGSVQDAVNMAGFVPQTAMGTEEGMIGYRMAIISRQDSDVQSPDDLSGQELAFVSESSGSGYFAPRALLYEEFDMLPGEDYDVVFSGSHDNSILGVYMGDYAAAPVADVVIDRMYQGGRIEDPEGWLHTVYESPLFPSTAYGVAHNLNPDLQEEIKQAFLSFDWEGTMLSEQWEEEDQFVEIDYQQDWEISRVIRQGSQTVAELLGE
ncbi:phosphate/phosphite/phosphonate ABC transporter substrate-binding protein [Halomonas sp. ML-15]|uniref:phosphate/phosphite/phosphonate ABC transporter substrate-binding protein n=1 Tax=Halomonas sp. ML-15 TaxID=2773305 RepID=UPI001746C4BF|nr:phosphate/phosphite/phosphonate ABC transporter substrate-binding protein [Halomonas sp. ML-15]MBD3896461.1 phosphate/phosphite/phosphonate ABC transporter substrate-binding protein [Halomonas sp. ML-15]